MVINSKSLRFLFLFKKIIKPYKSKKVGVIKSVNPLLFKTNNTSKSEIKPNTNNQKFFLVFVFQSLKLLRFAVFLPLKYNAKKESKKVSVIIEKTKISNNSTESIPTKLSSIKKPCNNCLIRYAAKSIYMPI